MILKLAQVKKNLIFSDNLCCCWWSWWYDDDGDGDNDDDDVSCIVVFKPVAGVEYKSYFFRMYYDHYSMSDWITDLLKKSETHSVIDLFHLLTVYRYLLHFFV